MSALPPRREPPDDADEQYRRASEHDPSRPSEATRRAVLSHAARLAAERARRRAARPWWSFAGVTSGWRPALIGTVAAAVLAGVVIAPQFLAPRVRDESQLAPAPGAAAPAPAPAQAVASVAAQRAPEGRTAPTASTESARPAPPRAVLQRPRLSATANRPPAPAAPAAAEAPASAANDAVTTLQVEARAGANTARVVAPAAAKARSGAALSPSPARAAPDALRQAAQDGDVAALATLLQGGSDVDARDAEGRTALMQAILHGQAQAVAALLDHGADPNAADAHGTTPLEAAVAGDQREIIAALRRYGAR